MKQTVLKIAIPVFAALVLLTCPPHIVPNGVIRFFLTKGEGDGQETAQVILIINKAFRTA
jgi:hypothetical protein